MNHTQKPKYNKQPTERLNMKQKVTTTTRYRHGKISHDRGDSLLERVTNRDGKADGYSIKTTGNELLVRKSPFFTFAKDGELNGETMEYKEDGYSKTYCLGHDWFDLSAAPYPVFSIETGDLVPHSTYYTWAHNIEGCLKNGSYVARRGKTRLVQYMNGDYMGQIEAVPEGMVEVNPNAALDLLPKCCG